MKKIVSLVLVIICAFQLTSYAATEFIRGNAPKIEETRIDTADNFFHAKIFNVNGVPYIYKGSKTNPVPYDESLSEIYDKNYIITDNYYIAHEYENRAAISGGAYVPFTTLLIYDKQMNLLHEEDFGGGVCVYDIGYHNGVIYCEYAEKLEEVFEDGNYHFKRSYNPYINRNSSKEKIEWVTVKSTDMVNWEKCDEDIPISNSRVSILDDKISLFEKEPVNVAYESNEEYKLNKTQIKLGDWFLVGAITQGKHFLSNIYLTNDFVYFVPINIPEEANEAFNKNQVNVLGEVYEYDGKIIVNYEDLKYYLKTPADGVYAKLNQIKDAPYIKFQDEILGFETPPVIEDGSTLVPMRFLFEQMGANVEWDGATQTATATLDNTVVTFSIDNTTAKVNGSPAKMNVPARLINDKTMVPLRFLSEELGFTVDWDAETRTASIYKE